MRILLADDHEMMREGLCQHLRQLADDTAIVEVSNYDDLLALATNDNDDDDSFNLILIDLHMPGLNGIARLAAVQRVCKTFPGTPVVVISGSCDRVTITEVLHMGARGFLPKTARGQLLRSALRLVLSGETYVPFDVIGDLPPAGAIPATRSADTTDVLLSRLTNREAGILTLVVQGQSNKEIARDLGLADVTVKLHLRSIYRKLGASSRVDAVRIALRHGQPVPSA